MITVALAPHLLLILSSLSGFSLKLADIHSERQPNMTSYTIAGATAILFGLLIADNPSTSTLTLGIMIGVTLAAKVNRKSLIFGGAATMLTAFILGIATPIAWMTITVATLTWIDEIGHDKLESDTGFPSLFFRYRLTLKLGILILTATGQLATNYAASFYGFDIAYEITGWHLTRTADKINTAKNHQEEAQPPHPQGSQSLECCTISVR